MKKYVSITIYGMVIRMRDRRFEFPTWRSVFRMSLRFRDLGRRAGGAEIEVFDVLSGCVTIKILNEFLDTCACGLYDLVEVAFGGDVEVDFLGVYVGRNPADLSGVRAASRE